MLIGCLATPTRRLVWRPRRLYRLRLRAEAAANPLGAAFSSAGVVRTRFYDDYLLAAARAGCRQVVLLAAGLDTRAFRLMWPAGVTVFELDLPAVLGFKDRVLR